MMDVNVNSFVNYLLFEFFPHFSVIPDLTISCTLLGKKKILIKEEKFS